MINPTPVDPPRSSPYGVTTPQPFRPNLPRTITPVPPKKGNWKRIVGLIFLSLVVASGTYVFAQLKSFKDNVLVAHEGEDASILAYDPSNTKAKIDASLFKKAGDGRFNMVIVGVGGDNHPGANLTDSIQVLSLDTINKKVGVTSIPRDLYVSVPGGGQTKINAAYQIGEDRRKGGGPLLLRQVIGNVLGITVSNFVLIDFAGAKQLVDALGGIDVTVPKAIYDPYFPDDATVGYSPFSIAAGTQHLDGKTALRYARSRETTSDFDRSARQQIVIAALKKKALSLGTLTNPAKVSSLMDALGRHIKTDMQADQIKSFVSLYSKVPSDQTTTNVLDTSENLGLLSATTSSTAGYIAYPSLGYNNYNAIHNWFQKNNPDPFLLKETPSISVVAGTGTTTKQLQEIVQTLKDYGYNASISTTPISKSRFTKTTVYDTTKGQKPFSRNYLNSLLSITTQNGSLLDSGSDYELIYIAEKKK